MRVEVQLVVCRLAGGDYGVPIEQVKEINRYVEVTRIPKAPASVLGVINLRGQVIPVVSLRERFGFPPEQIDAATRIIVSDVRVGFVVDGVTEVLRLDSGTIVPPPETTKGMDSVFIKGIAKLGERLIIVLDLEKIIDFSLLATAV